MPPNKITIVSELMKQFCLEGKITVQHASEIKEILNAQNQALWEAMEGMKSSHIVDPLDCQYNAGLSAAQSLISKE